MFTLKKVPMLQPGDTVATVSLSWGGAGDKDLLWRYQQGKQNMQQALGVKVVEMPHTLKGTDYLYQHPEKRAQDLMDAFRNPEIKAVFSCIGGSESIRMLPFIDMQVLHDNPKIFCGYSDSTITHMFCLKAGITSFYGPSVLAEFAENVEIPPYTLHWLKKMMFSPDPAGEIPSSPIWTGQYLPWDIKNKNTKRTFVPNEGIQLLQGEGIAAGPLLGGCIEVLEMVKGTLLFPPLHYFDGAILFFETSEEMPTPSQFEYWLRWYSTTGILQRINGMLFGKPSQNKYYEEYQQVILKILAECGRSQLPVLYNLNFGHTTPMFPIPMGCQGQINCKQKSFSILDSGVYSE